MTGLIYGFGDSACVSLRGGSRLERLAEGGGLVNVRRISFGASPVFRREIKTLCVCVCRLFGPPNSLKYYNNKFGQNVSL